ncbi:MAG: cupin domain-containing protein [Candidatus Omnitrophota bacterium]|jgi:hypothetical protein
MAEAKTQAGILVEKPSPDKLSSLGIRKWPIWEKEVSEFDWHYDEPETCFFLEGDVTVCAGDAEVSFGKGDLVTFPSGLDCRWKIKKAVRKHYRFG